MGLSHQVKDNICIVHVADYSIGKDAVKLSSYISMVLDQLSPKAILMNLEKIESIDSAGLSYIIISFNAAKEQQVGFALCRLTRTVLEAFQFTGFDKLVPIFETEVDALDFFQSGE
ncbi:MAG: anti-sigma factor antagonist [SAR324 cluster bacterium]|nr:anti-sigma factor antagonist [SAR324 cluster bacterium]